jgi:type II secretory pathway component PulF
MASRLSVKRLAQFSRKMHTTIKAGVPLTRALEILGKNAKGVDRQVIRGLAREIENGASLTKAMEAQGRAFPTLYRNLINAGEFSGGLEEVFLQLADYYDLVRQMWRRLIGALTYPVIEYFLLIVVLAFVTYITTMFIEKGTNPEGPAIRVLLTGIGIFFIPIVLYLVLTRLLSGRRFVHEILNRVPIIGRVMRSLALWRFCWCMHLMTNAGVAVLDAVVKSAQATANGAYAAQGPKIAADLRQGVPMYAALERTGLFPNDVIEMVHVGEESGEAPDMFRRMAVVFQERVTAALAFLSVVFGWLIWLIVAGVIICYIFKFASMYIGMYNRLGV